MLLTPQAEAPGSTALHIACTNDNHEAVAYLLAKGADVNAMNEYATTHGDTRHTTHDTHHH
jgi:ankyrin repeat protein